MRADGILREICDNSMFFKEMIWVVLSCGVQPGEQALVLGLPPSGVFCISYRTYAKPPQRRSSASPYFGVLSSALCLAGTLLRKSYLKQEGEAEIATVDVESVLDGCGAIFLFTRLGSCHQ
jgi:hypothetical protein